MHVKDERHFVGRSGWIRAAVLGANDGTISVSSLVVGIASSGANNNSILISGIAATVAGAFSMAAGEYVSVQSQAAIERADLAKEKAELLIDPEGELHELTEIYVRRGLSKPLAAQVAYELMSHDALGSHARDELGISDSLSAKPIQAALTSAACFTMGAAVPIITILLATPEQLSRYTFSVALLALMGMGAASAWAGGTPVGPAILRMLVWGALAMGATAWVGHLSGSAMA
jgi:VIT1/CCC1 family predicted Fe2+/Mn2+ transporter